MSLQGRQLGRYRILEPLGSGGMSVVYRGHDTSLDRVVAVKVLHPHLAGKQESRRRLAREAQAVARLRHPNILEIYDFSSEEADEAYLVTEYIRGQTLRQFLEQERLDPPEVAALVIHGLADALARAHAAGVVHRDLKPDNVMVREDGVLKLMDFGIAKLLDREERMTMTGALMGSPAHMAPEVIEGEAVGPAADVFSLGTMLYLFVTGELPFVGPNATATLKRILDGQYPPARERCPALSRELAAVIDRALARRPEDRFPDAGALRDALAACLATVELHRPDEELATFFAAPAIARAVLVKRMVPGILERAERAGRAGQTHEAIDLLNQAQSLDPENPRALALLGALQLARLRRARVRQALRYVGGTAGAMGLVALALWGGSRREAGASAPEVVSPGPLTASLAPPPLPARGTMTPVLTKAAPPAVDGNEQASGTSEPSMRASEERIRIPPSKSGRMTSRAVGTATAPAPGRGPSRAPAVLPVEINIRPWAHVALDDGDYSEKGVQRLTVALAPGSHRVRMRCPFCEETEERIDVQPGGPSTFALSPRLKPARLSFEVSPEGAEVEIDGVRRLASATLREPFLLRTPKGETPQPHEVRYTVSMPGYAPQTGRVRLEVGQSHTERAALVKP